MSIEKKDYIYEEKFNYGKQLVSMSMQTQSYYMFNQLIKQKSGDDILVPKF